MTFRSILFESGANQLSSRNLEAPEYFTDLHLTQVVAAIVGRDDYDLTPYFSLPLTSVAAVEYRQEIVRDLRSRAVRDCLDRFAQKMRTMRENLRLQEHLYYRYSVEGWFLYSVGVYCDAVSELERGLADEQLSSRGFSTLGQYLAEYVRSEAFMKLRADTERVSTELSRVTYSLTITGDRIHVSDYEGGVEYSPDVLATFAKFARTETRAYGSARPESPEMNHVEAALVEMVARLNPTVFAALHDYCERHKTFADETIATFDREVQFYLAYLAYIDRFTPLRLNFCEPHVHDDSKAVSASETFDIALAEKLSAEGTRVVCNDFFLAGAERIFVVSGPNQGGKTTFARTFGQLHHLASLGLPVPGAHAELYLFDHLFTHFEKQEDPLGVHGKLENDLLRIRDIFQRATGHSIVILNEIFTSTTLDDAVFLGTNVLDRLMRMGAVCVCVTFLDELASLGDATVSMVSTVEPDDPAVRTLKVVRRPANGLAYAAAIAEKHHVSYPWLKKRLTGRLVP